MISIKSPLKRQRGDILIESMIGLLLMGIMGLSLSMAVGRASINQQDMAVRNIAVTQLRDLLQRNRTDSLDLCKQGAQIKLPHGLSLPVSVSGCASSSITVAGMVLDDIAPPLRLSVSSELLGGTINVGGGS